MRKIATTLIICSTLLVGCTEKETPVDDNPVKKEEQQVVNKQENNKIDISAFQSNVETQITSSGVKFRVAVMNTSNEEAKLTFSSGQQFDILVTNSNGDKVYEYASEKTFSQASTSVVLGSNKANVWESEWEIDTSLLEEGQYKVESLITVNQINDFTLSSQEKNQLKAVSTFDIKHHKETTSTKNPRVEGKSGIYKVTGTVQTDKDVYYSVEDGHNLLVEETPVELKKSTGDTRSFEININIPKDNLPINGVVSLELYSKDVDGTYTPLQSIELEHIGPSSN